MFQVIWRDQVYDMIASVMVRVDLPTQDDIERKILRLTRRLEADPLNEGESRWDEFRVVYDLPVGLLFFVDSANRVVIVTRFLFPR